MGANRIPDTEFFVLQGELCCRSNVGTSDILHRRTPLCGPATLISLLTSVLVSGLESPDKPQEDGHAGISLTTGLTDTDRELGLPQASIQHGTCL